MREYVVKCAQKRRYYERYAYNQSRISNGLIARRPRDMAHFNACFLYVFCEFHISYLKIDYNIKASLEHCVHGCPHASRSS